VVYVYFERFQEWMGGARGIHPRPEVISS